MDRSRSRRRLLALAIGVLLVAPLGSVRAATHVVREQGTRFIDAQVDVTVGDSVSWMYQSSPDDSGHTVIFEDPTLNDSRFANCPGTILGNDCQRSSSPPVTRTFSRVGTFPYYCKLHRDRGMTGVVVVTAAATTSSTSAASTSSTLARATTTSSTAKSSSTSSTTATTRQLATSSTLVKSTTTTADTTSVLLPGDAPSFDDTNSSAAGSSGGSDDGGDSGTVALIAGLLLAVGVGGGFLLWRLRPGRG